MNNMNFDDLKRKLSEIYETCEAMKDEISKDCRKRPLTMERLCSHCPDIEKCSFLSVLKWRMNYFITLLEEMERNE